MAMLVGAARVLAERRRDLRGRVLCVFQPGEEAGAGAKLLLEGGLLTTVQPPLSGAFALHVTTKHEAGAFASKPGPIMGANDTIRIVIRGRSGHASAPELAINPVVIGGQLAVVLSGLVPQTLSVFDPAVCTISRFQSGNHENVIPAEALLEGTLRTVTASSRATMQARIRGLAERVCAANGAECEVEILEGYPPTERWAFTQAERLVGAAAAIRLEHPELTSEDFSYILNEIPGALFWLGARPADLRWDAAPTLHSDRVTFDEGAMVRGIALYAAIALAFADFGQGTALVAEAPEESRATDYRSKAADLEQELRQG